MATTLPSFTPATSSLLFSTLKKPLSSVPPPKTLFRPFSPTITTTTIIRLSKQRTNKAQIITSSSSSSSLSTIAPPPTLKTRLKNGDTLYCLFLLSFSPTLAEIAGLSGYDFVVVDMEHGRRKSNPIGDLTRPDAPLLLASGYSSSAVRELLTVW